jgi:hypothetical protein
VFTNSYKMKMSIVLGVCHVRIQLSHNLYLSDLLVDGLRAVLANSEPPPLQTPC